MGIPYYFNTLYRKYADKNIVLGEHDLKKIVVDHLFLDYNSMIHPCAHQILGTMSKDDVVEDLDMIVIHHTLLYTRYVIGLLSPKHVYIMVDGVAPRAKINQQRERRYKSHFFKPLYSQGEDETNVTWDSNKITPGTLFMQKLSEALEQYTNDMKDTCHIHVSDSTCQGEGEHKMMQYMTNIDVSDKICIYGLDGDLIMLSLTNMHAKNIILLRDNSFQNKHGDTDFTYLNIATLQSAIYNELQLQFKKECVKTRCNPCQFPNTVQVIWDYICMCFMLGNDFLEHVPGISIRHNGVNKMIQAYITAFVKNKTPLVNIQAHGHTKIQLDMLQDILQELSTVESCPVNVQCETYRDVSLEGVEDIGVSCIRDDFIQMHQPGYKKRYYTYHGMYDVDGACREFIQGLYWNLGYYNGHEHQNWMWFYPCAATPFASDLYLYLKNTRNRRQFEQYMNTSPALQPSNACTSLEQLLMVLPQASLLQALIDIEETQVHSKLIRLLRVPSTCIQDMYPTKITIDIVNKQWLWQAKVFLQTVDLSQLRLIFDL